MCIFLSSYGHAGRFDDSVIEERRQCSEDLLQFSANIPALYNSQHIQDFFKVSTQTHTHRNSTIHPERILPELKKKKTPKQNKLFSRGVKFTTAQSSLDQLRPLLTSWLTIYRTAALTVRVNTVTFPESVIPVIYRSSESYVHVFQFKETPVAQMI